VSFTSDTYINPVETGLYYLGSRYYDPEVGRFISADTTDILGVSSDLYDKNLYAYCDNNPVMRIDADGELWITALAVGAGLGVLTQAVADIGIGLLSGNSLGEIVQGLSPVDYVSAAISGALAATGISAMGSIVANATLGGATYLANCSYKGEKANVVDFAISTGVGAAAGYRGGSGVNAERMRGVYHRSEQVLKTAKSAKKVAQYNTKKTMVKTTVKTGIKNTVIAGFWSNVGNFFRKLFTGSRA
jgi:RHS repeat-associated protein